MSHTEPVVLAVDDERGVLRLLKSALTPMGFRVVTSANGEQALRIAELQRPDIVILDIIMPGLSGFEVMQRLRGRTNVPIIFLTSKKRDAELVQVLDSGADDYVIKPFDPRALAARLRAVLSRKHHGTGNNETLLTRGDLVIDLEDRMVTRSGKPINLTRTEWLLLQELARNAGKVMLSSELLERIWGPEIVDDIQHLRVCVSRLRSKIEVDPGHPTFILNIPGLGYTFAANDG